MQPTLLPGRIVLFRGSGVVRVGDIVIFSHDGVEKVKRVTRIDNERIYVLGDNPTASTDSRHFGWVELESVGGTLVWPRKNRLPRGSRSSV